MGKEVFTGETIMNQRLIKEHEIFHPPLIPPIKGGKVPSPLVGEGLGEGYFRINTILGESMPNIETDTPDVFRRIMSEKKKTVLPNHINIDQADVSKGLAKLVLTIIELLRELLERQAIRRIDSGTLTKEEINNLG